MMFKIIAACIACTVVVGCGSVPQNTNVALAELSPSVHTNRYVVSDRMRTQQDGNTIVLLSFSGGGTRAAAFSYGVLKGLNDYTFYDDGQPFTLLEKVNAISSVSGGSFTSAYYGLHGEEIFDTFEERFLYKDVTMDLKDIAMSLGHLFSSDARSVAAADYYKDYIFEDKLFSDIREDGPMIIINATDLSTGARFSYTQEYFDIICSDINEYSVHNAVTASSAVPFLFSPVLLENYDDCEKPIFLSEVNGPSNHASTNTALARFHDHDKYHYLHLVDGGISDNLGLHALYDLVTTEGFGVREKNTDIDTIVIVSVDAAVRPDWNIGTSNHEPTLQSILGSASDVQIHRYNDLSKTYLKMVLDEWSSKVDGRRYLYVDINLANAQNQEVIQSIATDFHLPDEQVDMLIEHGYQEIILNQQLSDFLQEHLNSTRIESRGINQ